MSRWSDHENLLSLKVRTHDPKMKRRAAPLIFCGVVWHRQPPAPWGEESTTRTSTEEAVEAEAVAVAEAAVEEVGEAEAAATATAPLAAKAMVVIPTLHVRRGITAVRMAT